MTYVIGEPCVNVFAQACVTVCLVGCIHFEEASTARHRGFPHRGGP